MLTKIIIFLLLFPIIASGDRSEHLEYDIQHQKGYSVIQDFSNNILSNFKCEVSLEEEINQVIVGAVTTFGSEFSETASRLAEVMEQIKTLAVSNNVSVNAFEIIRGYGNQSSDKNLLGPIVISQPLELTLPKNLANLDIFLDQLRNVGLTKFGLVKNLDQLNSLSNRTSQVVLRKVSISKDYISDTIMNCLKETIKEKCQDITFSESEICLDPPAGMKQLIPKLNNLRLNIHPMPIEGGTNFSFSFNELDTTEPRAYYFSSNEKAYLRYNIY